MSLPHDQSVKVVLYEGPVAQPLSAPRRLAVLTSLLEAGYRVTCTGPEGRTTDDDAAATVILGRFDGSAAPDGLVAGGEQTVCRDIADLSGADVLQAVEEAREAFQLPRPGQWIPWFPVLDYDRCARCGQCANFCIFGTFSVSDDGTVRVANPEDCKTDCPACARICPQVAIIFPKYPHPPINGAEVTDEDVQKEMAATDLKAKLQGDVYAVLRRRGKRGAASAGKAKSRPSIAEVAEVLKRMDIPTSVLMSLPVANNAPGDSASGGPADERPGEPPTQPETPDDRTAASGEQDDADGDREARRRQTKRGRRE